MSALATPAYHRRRVEGVYPPHADVPANVRLATLRQRTSLSIEDVAHRLGCDPDRWRDIEEGWERAPSGDVLFRWARWLEDQASPGWDDQ